MEEFNLRKVERRRNWLVFSFLLVSSMGVLLVTTGAYSILPERIAMSVMAFFERGFSAVSGFFSETVDSVASLRTLKKDYDELLKKHERYTNLEIELSSLRKENERLRSALSFVKASDRTLLPANVVGKDPSNATRTIIIDRGEVDGVRLGMAVIAYQEGGAGLVGKVVEVGTSSCLVKPIHDAGIYVAARLERSRYEGLIEGPREGGMPLRLLYVKKRARDQLQYGDIVLSSGTDSIFPQGLLIGRVTRIGILDYASSLEIDVEPYVDFARLELVFVILDSVAEGAVR